MLAGITPLGEQGRGNRWYVTVSAFLVGAVAAGLAIGATLGAIGSALGTATWSPWVSVVSVGLGALVGGLVDLGVSGTSLPTIRRQVNASWMTTYRGWVYGAGFGFQLGLGVSTIVTASATYVCVMAALLTGSTLAGAAVMATYGLVRGLSVMPAAWITRPSRVLRLSRLLGRWDQTVGRGVVLGQICVTIGLMIWVWI